MAYSAELRKEFKATARARIRENFWPTMGAVILGAVPGVLGSIVYERGQGVAAALLYFIILFFVVLPMQFGMMHFYVARSRGQEVPLSTIFCCFGHGRSYRNSLLLAIAIVIRSIGWCVLEVLAVVAFAALMVATGTIGMLDGNRMAFTGVVVLGMALSGAVLIVVSAIVNVKIRRYDAAYVLMIDNPEGSVWKATGKCAALFREHNWELFVFDLSFILWVLGTVCTFGILGIYLSAYQDMAYVRYVDALRRNKSDFSATTDPNSLPPL